MEGIFGRFFTVYGLSDEPGMNSNILSFASDGQLCTQTQKRKKSQGRVSWLLDTNSYPAHRLEGVTTQMPDLNYGANTIILVAFNLYWIYDTK